MPLLETDVREVASANNDIPDGEYRPRSGSTGLRGLFSKRQRKPSGDESATNKKESKVKNFFDSFRPRSKSDLSGIKKPGKKHSAKLDQSMDESNLREVLTQDPSNANDIHMRSGGNNTLMGQILEGQLSVPNDNRTRHKSGPPTPMDYSRFRTRSNSDSLRVRPPRKPLVHQVREFPVLTYL